MAVRQRRAARPIARGDVVLVLFPLSDLSQTKRRPAVVLWAHPAQTDFTLAFMSSQQVSQVGIGEVTILPTHPEFTLAGLSVPSKIRTTKLVTLSRAFLKRWLGRLGPLLTTDLDRALVTGLEINTALSRRRPQRGTGKTYRNINAGDTVALFADLGLPIAS